MSAIEGELARLGGVLAALGDPLAGTLAPPARPEAIEAAAGLPRPLPEEVRRWYGWHDGLVGDRDADYELVPGLAPLSLAEAAETAATFRQVADQVAGMDGVDAATLWDPRWLPVARTEMIAVLVVTCDASHAASSPVSYRLWEDPALRHAYDSLASMAASARECWEAGAYTRGERGEVVDRPAAVAGIWARHNPRAAAANPGGPPPGVVSGPAVPDEPEEALLARLGSRDEIGRWEAVAALAARGHGAALDPAVTMLGHPEAPVRWSGALALGDLGDAAAAPHLVEALRDPEGQVRTLVADALGKLGPGAGDAALAALRRAASDDPDETVRATAGHALERLRG